MNKGPGGVKLLFHPIPGIKWDISWVNVLPNRHLLFKLGVKMIRIEIQQGAPGLNKKQHIQVPKMVMMGGERRFPCTSGVQKNMRRRKRPAASPVIDGSSEISG